LFQSGYLTFKTPENRRGHLLDYPNYEVRNSVSTLMLGAAYDIDNSEQKTIANAIYDGLDARDFAPVFAEMKRTLAMIPGKLYAKSDYPDKEAYYHTVLLTLLWGCNLHVKAEEWSARGVSDIVLNYDGDIYIIELKKAPCEVSLKQIRDKGYGEKYANAPYLAFVGIQIDTEHRSLAAYKLEEA
jgi:hypothetical protein